MFRLTSHETFVFGPAPKLHRLLFGYPLPCDPYTVRDWEGVGLIDSSSSPTATSANPSHGQQQGFLSLE